MKALWRISNRCNLEGMGGERSDGRWHTATHGKRIVYFSEHPAVALLEVLANLKGNPKLFPDAYQLMKAGVPDSVAVSHLPQDGLTGNWRRDLPRTQGIGDTWLRENRSALLEVPSVPSPESFNFLLNPLHPEARLLSIEWCKWVDYDQRLFRLREG